MAAAFGLETVGGHTAAAFVATAVRVGTAASDVSALPHRSAGEVRTGADRLKPLNVSQMPSDSSHSATGTNPIADSTEPCSFKPRTDALAATRNRGDPMSAIAGMTRGTSRDRYM